MTDAAALRKALERADGACPCRQPTHASPCNSCPCENDFMEADEEIRPSICLWPGHAAIREAMWAAAKFGFDYGGGCFGDALAAILGPPERKEE